MRIIHIVIGVVIALILSGCDYSPDPVNNHVKDTRLKAVVSENVGGTWYGIVEDTLTGTQYLRTSGGGIVRMDNPADLLFPLPRHESKVKEVK